MILRETCFHLRAAAVVLIALGFLGCGNSPESEKLSFMAEEIRSIKKQINDKDLEIIGLKNSIDKLRGDLEDINIQILSLKAGIREARFNNRDPFQAAYLTPGKHGFQVIQHELGSLAFILEDVKPDENGSRITLKIGNPLSSDLIGAKATVVYGPQDKTGIDVKFNSKTKEILLAKKLKGGTWTDAHILLDGIPPVMLGFVKLDKISFETLMLLKPKKKDNR